MTDEMRDRVAEALAEHVGIDAYDADGVFISRYGCRCGYLAANDGDMNAHYADALLPLLTEAEARGVERGRAEVRARVERELVAWERAVEADAAMGTRASKQALDAIERLIGHTRAALTEEQPVVHRFSREISIQQAREERP